MSNLFYLISIIFILSNFYYFSNRKVLDSRFKEKESKSKLQLIYYYIEIFYWIWLLIGLIYGEYFYHFLLLFIVPILKFPLYHISKKYYIIYVIFIPIINIISIILLNIKLL